MSFELEESKDRKTNDAKAVAVDRKAFRRVSSDVHVLSNTSSKSLAENEVQNQSEQLRVLAANSAFYRNIHLPCLFLIFEYDAPRS